MLLPCWATQAIFKLLQQPVDGETWHGEADHCPLPGVWDEHGAPAGWEDGGLASEPPAAPQKAPREADDRPEPCLPSWPREVLPRVLGLLASAPRTCFFLFLPLEKNKNNPNPGQTIKMFQLLARSSNPR